MMISQRILSALGLCSGMLAASVQAEVPERMLRWIPADANAVVSVDVNAIFHAPLAQREGWKKRSADRFVNQEISIPPEARRLLMASQLDLGGTLQPTWEVGVMELERTPSFALLARNDGGHLDTIAGLSAIRLSSGRTGVELESGLVLGTPEPNRQLISRWINSSKAAAAPKVSPFLKTALEKSDPKAHVVLAVDLSDCVTVPPVRQMLSEVEALKGKTADQADIAEILASVRGVVMTVQVTDRREGVVRVEFGKPTALMKPVAKPVTEEILRALSISLVDFDNWIADVSDSTMTLKGEFSEADMRRVVSLVAASPSTQAVREPEPTAETSTPAATSPAVKAEVSRRYFQSVKGLVDELRKTLNKSRDNHVVWMERYARKIDDLPIKDVDPDLLNFGGNVSSSLRYQAQAGRTGALRAGVREAQPVYQSYSYSAGVAGPYGSYAGYSNWGTARVSPDRTLIRTEEHANAAQVKNSEMKQIDDGMVKIRREMTARYNIEF